MADPADAGAPPGSDDPDARSRWERVRRPAGRPAEPHDWRWAVGLVGRAMITVGLLTFAFVGYQLWGTGIQTARAQERLADELAEVLAGTTTVPGTTLPVTTAPATTTGSIPPGSPPGQTVPGTATPPSDPGPTTVPPTTVPPTTTMPTTMAPTPSTVTAPSTVPGPSVTAPAQGRALAALEIPAIGLKKTVVEGVSVADLQMGPGHFPETPLPGQYGNAAIAGHRTTYGQPFSRLDELGVGDEITLTTAWGTFVYAVTDQFVVEPTDYAQVVPTTDARLATLTLVTCTPKWTARQRLVIKAVIVAERSSPLATPVPPAGPVTPSTLPGDETTPTTAAPATDVPSTAAPATTTSPAATSSTAPGTTSATDPPAAPPATLPGSTPPTGGVGNSPDAFSQGWFDDRGAYPHVVAWGLLLALIAVGATAAGRLAGRRVVGILTGAVPFVVVLYFFFENLNRLLPPNL